MSRRHVGTSSCGPAILKARICLSRMLFVTFTCEISWRSSIGFQRIARLDEDCCLHRKAYASLESRGGDGGKDSREDGRLCGVVTNFARALQQL